MTFNEIDAIYNSVACEDLNHREGYTLKWVDIEMMNTEEEPYCNIGKSRLTRHRKMKLF